MVYVPKSSVLFVEKDPRLDNRVEGLLRKYQDRFEVSVVPSGEPVPEDGYRRSDVVVAHINGRRATQLLGLRRRHRDVELLIIPVGFVGDVHKELQKDADGAYFLGSGFTEQDLVDSVSRLAADRRRQTPSPVY